VNKAKGKEHMAEHFEKLKNLTAQADFAKAKDPLALFSGWFSDAGAGESQYPDAACLATADKDGMPDARMVLLKSFDEDGFVFYTNMESAKGRQLQQNPKAALCFHWKSIYRQVRLRGNITMVSEKEADAYFNSRPRKSRIGAWASKQSRQLEGRLALEKAVALYAARYAIGQVPRPPYWTGCQILPLQMEFWHERPFRLHERLVFLRDDPQSPWTKKLLYP
jgi:pyridoxamine 5'-phosphate oxidase